MSAKRFRIAFSFAGEKRDFVEKVAAILAKRFDEAVILYDKYHEAEFARARLGRYLPKLYHDQSDLVVVVICRDYAQKEWCGLEWDAIFDLLRKRREDEVMLCRFDYATVEGLFSDAGFSDLDHKTPEQTADLILERLALNEGKPKDHYTKPDSAGSKHLSTTTPNNLPRLQPFFGRTEEIKQIAEALDPESRTWGALIDGPGGMGKTSLAVRAAYDCAPGQFQRIIFLSVKDCELDDDGVRKLGGFILPGFLAMLNELARELGQPDIAKAPEDQRIKLLLDALRPAQALLILDNLESIPKDDRDQLFTFVNRLPQGSKAILTSRRRIGSGSEELILEQLDQIAALATLSDLAWHNKLLAKSSEAERIGLYEQTGGKPLLLRWVAGQLGRGSCRTLGDALAFLRSCPPDNDPLEFIFGDLAQDFTEDETKVLVALTYFALPAKVEHIAEVSGLEKKSVETALRTLASRSLVVPDQEETAFALVPMVANFLRRKRPEVVAETGNRLEERAYALILENGYQKHGRFPVLDAAWPVVAPALPILLTGPNNKLQTICGALFQFFNFTGRWDELIALSIEAEAKAVDMGDFLEAGWRSIGSGYIHYRRHESAKLLSCVERVDAYWQKVSVGVNGQAFAVRMRAHWHRLNGDYRKAIKAYKQAVGLWRTLGEETMEFATGVNALAEAERQSGDLNAAKCDYTEALRLARAANYVEGIASYTGNLAEVALDLEDWCEAEFWARKALALNENIRRKELIARDCLCLAKALVRQGKPAEAVPYARRAVDIYARLGSPYLEDARAVLREAEG